MIDLYKRIKYTHSLAVIVPAVIFLFGSAALGLFAYQHFSNSLETLRSNEMRIGSLLGLNSSASLEASLRRGDLASARQAVEQANLIRGLKFALYADSSSEIVFATSAEIAGKKLNNVVPEERLIQVERARRAMRGDVRLQADQDTVLGIYPVFLDTLHANPAGIFMHEHSFANKRLAAEREAWLTVLVGALFLASLCLLLWALLHRVLLKRIDRVRDFASNLASGEGVQPIKVSGQDEIGVLARHLESAAETLAERTQMLHQSQKMEAVGRLAGGVAHDFNNLLTVIFCGCHLLKQTSDSTPEQQEKTVADILHAAEQAAALTKQLLAFSRQDMPQPKVIDPSLVIRDMSSMLDRVIGPNHTMEVRVNSSAKVRMDRIHLEQIIMNLVVNARDAMPNGGRICVEYKDRDSMADYANPEVIIRVSDSGPGIPDDLKEKIFEPFFTTKPIEKGTGLGLWAVFTAVEKSGGYIELNSDPTSGTQFDIILPATPEKSESEFKPDELQPRVDAQELHVLLCDDEPAVRDATAKALESLGIHVDAQADANAALMRLADESNSIDVLLTDVLMPDMSGVELARAAREMKPDLRVVFLSGYASGISAEDIHSFDNADFLQKPFSSSELLASCRGKDK